MANIRVILGSLMKPKNLALALCFFLLTASAQAEMKQGAGFSFAENVPDAQRIMLTEDLEALQSMQLPEQDPEALATLEIPEMSGKSLGAWLSERLQIIVGESFRLDDSVFFGNEKFTYENPGQLPELEQPGKTIPAQGPLYTVATNISSTIYLTGKMQDEILQADIPGRELLSVRSPRTGIIKIGEGLFRPLLKRYGWKAEEISTEVNRLVRLGALFHEARHSDGHGASLTFVHATCPPGHDYAGLVVCDRSLNGAYAVGGLVQRNLLKQCTKCSVAEQEAFRLYTYDSFNRIIRVTRTQDENGAIKVVPTGFLDASPEGKR
jgi:hypothetical protein